MKINKWLIKFEEKNDQYIDNDLELCYNKLGNIFATSYDKENITMQDHYEHKQDEYYRQLKEKRARKKQIINAVFRHLLFLLAGNAFPFAIYFMALSKLVSEQLASGKEVAGLVCIFGFAAQCVMLCVVSAITYGKDEPSHRQLLHASREEGFNRIGYFLTTLKEYAWMMPVAYLIMQFPFMLYYAALGYYYEAETLFAHFFIPQLALFEWTHSGFIGMILNTLLLAIIYASTIFIIQQKWLRDRIRA